MVHTEIIWKIYAVLGNRINYYQIKNATKKSVKRKVPLKLDKKFAVRNIKMFV